MQMTENEFLALTQLYATEQKATRDARADRSNMLRGMFQQLMEMAPTIINSMIEKPAKGVVNGSSDTGSLEISVESTVLSDFLAKMTSKQMDVVFGRYAEDDIHQCVQPGVLTLAQSTIIYRVAKRQIPPDMLYWLMPDGPLAVSQEQMTTLVYGCGFSQAEITPLMVLFAEKASKDATKKDQKSPDHQDPSKSSENAEPATQEPASTPAPEASAS